MFCKQITKLLSHHRNPNDLTIPTTLSKNQIILLVRLSLPPNQSQNDLRNEIQETLRELEAQGEILAGGGNRYCIAPPTVLTLERDDLTRLIFRGDRAYLSLAHQVLKTEENPEIIYLRPQVHGFDRIKDILNQVSIRFLTLADSIEHLPQPQKPSKAILRSPWQDNPFELEILDQYVPAQDASQRARWISVTYRQLSDQALLQFSTGEYLWFQDGKFYELEPDTALLAMFYLDKETGGYPLKIEWNKPQGKLNLQGIILPSAYARWLWSLSEPDKQQYRTRYIKPLNQPLVEQAFQRLGCLLV